MLRGIPDIIGSDLQKALADTGHGDLIVIADHFYPPYSKSPHAVSIQAKGTGSV
ncbi:MAG: L-fucose mutarotase, partial [Oscillospiraceae bacterium]|nr:L-fucose mutarotase [Oscillospiraceae bacterium]